MRCKGHQKCQTPMREPWIQSRLNHCRKNPECEHTVICLYKKQDCTEHVFTIFSRFPTCSICSLWFGLLSFPVRKAAQGHHIGRNSVHCILQISPSSRGLAHFQLRNAEEILSWRWAKTQGTPGEQQNCWDMLGFIWIYDDF